MYLWYNYVLILEMFKCQSLFADFKIDSRVHLHVGRRKHELINDLRLLFIRGR